METGRRDHVVVRVLVAEAESAHGAGDPAARA